MDALVTTLALRAQRLSTCLIARRISRDGGGLGRILSGHGVATTAASRAPDSLGITHQPRWRSIVTPAMLIGMLGGARRSRGGVASRKGAVVLAGRLVQIRPGHRCRSRDTTAWRTSRVGTTHGARARRVGVVATTAEVAQSPPHTIATPTSSDGRLHGASGRRLGVAEWPCAGARPQPQPQQA